MQIDYKASDEIRAAIAELGRTEDVQFSPDNRRLAIAGMNEKKILVLDIWIERGGRQDVGRDDRLHHRHLAQPHPSARPVLDRRCDDRGGEPRRRGADPQGAARQSHAAAARAGPSCACSAPTAPICWRRRARCRCAISAPASTRRCSATIGRTTSPVTCSTSAPAFGRSRAKSCCPTVWTFPTAWCTARPGAGSRSAITTTGASSSMTMRRGSTGRPGPSARCAAWTIRTGYASRRTSGICWWPMPGRPSCISTAPPTATGAGRTSR